jgi:hypothetical protein
MNICSCGGRLAMSWYSLAMAACSGDRWGPSGASPPAPSGPAANAAARAACIAATASG